MHSTAEAVPAGAVGIIGGSGLYELPGLGEVREIELDTPFGAPSGPLSTGVLAGRPVVFLARHGKGHVLDPTHIPYQANIWAFKKLGVTRLLSLSAVGSMREEIAPGHMVVIDQFFDRTRHRPDSFFGDGCVAHVGFSDPVCAGLRAGLLAAADHADLPHLVVHDGGTYVCMEGPSFSTRAESLFYRGLKASVIGMTNLTEAKLAREAELCYATLALVTDYDCWHKDELAVTVADVLATMRHNISNALALLAMAVARVDPNADCHCRHALQGAIMTAPDHRCPKAMQRLALFLDSGHAD